MKRYQSLTVPELKELTKKAGLKVCTHNHKLNKAELIIQLRERDIMEEWWDETVEEVESRRISEYLSEKGKAEGERTDEKKEEVNVERPGIPFARTWDEIEEKYHNRKPDHVYESELDIGSWVVYLHTACSFRSGPIRRLRRAKVIAVDRENEIVYTELKSGTEVKLGFNDLYYIKRGDSYKYPNDLFQFIKNQK